MTDIATTASFEVEKFKQITDGAPAMLEQNETSKTAAISRANELFANIAQTGMSDAMDELLKTFISKSKTTIDAMNERRKPFTQLVDAVKKRFTTQESELKSIVETAQNHRNDYAAVKMKQREEAERQARLKYEKEQEKIRLQEKIRNYFAKCGNDRIMGAKRNALDIFNALTLENIDNTELFSEYSKELMFLHDVKYICSLFEINLVTESELLTLVNCEYKAYKVEISTVFPYEMSLYVQELRDLIPSKRAELEEAERQRVALQEAQQAEAKAQTEAEQTAARERQEAARLEQERIEAERKEREAAEASKIEAEQAAALEKSEQEAALRAQAAKVDAMMDSAQGLFPENLNVKEGYKIIVANPAAYLLIAQHWMEHEGKKTTIEKLEKVTFDRMRRYCEDYAAKNEEFIDSKMIKYEPVYKAK